MFFRQPRVGEKKISETDPSISSGSNGRPKNSQNWPLERNYRKQRGGSRQGGKKSVSDSEDNNFQSYFGLLVAKQNPSPPLHLSWVERGRKKRRSKPPYNE